MRDPRGVLTATELTGLLTKQASGQAVDLSPDGPGSGTSRGGVLPPGSEPLGDITGAPTPTVFRTVQIQPGKTSTRIAEPGRPNRVVIVTAPIIPFRFYIGGQGVKIGDMEITPGIPYDCVLPGLQELWAVTNAPVVLPLRVQIAPILIGDRERRWPK